jgi:lipoprotein NlpD
MHYRKLILFGLSMLLVLSGGCASRQAVPSRPPEPVYLETGAPAGTKARGIYHTVKRGETLYRIAKTYGVDLQNLAEINNITDPAAIKADQKIFVPGVSVAKPIPADDRDAPQSAPRIVRKRDFIWPVEGKVVSEFGIRDGLRFEGIEIAASLGAPVKACGDGEVVYQGNLKGYGNLVILRHRDLYKTVYAYNQANLVTAGTRVKRGETIATVGTSGASPNPCLYFQVREKDESRNPRFFLP